ncbi:hypothetical protein VTP01DRAFT_5431 [Rhizomucor pusillus]|uniref:uncharacterized protein n=1 Tax=Rhizomucor pusillus TaxID=4840 RepID=UPI0037437A08
MSTSKRSSDLVNVPGKEKTIAKLLAKDQPDEKQQDSSADVPKSKPKTYKIEPPSDILSRVQAFLPQLKSANEELSKADPSKLNIENLEDEDERYIEMNLGLGVFEEKRPGNASDSNSDDDDGDDIIIPSSSSKPAATKPSIHVLPKDDEEDKNDDDKIDNENDKGEQ